MKVAPNDGNHEWKSQGSGPRKRLRRAADAEPDRVCRDMPMRPIGRADRRAEELPGKGHGGKTY